MLQRKIIISSLNIPTFIGILEHEQAAEQPLMIDLVLTLASPKSVAPDRIEYVLDYRNIRQLLIQECQAQHTNLLETLCDRLTAKIFATFAEVDHIDLKILKTQAFSDCAAVGIQQIVQRNHFIE